MSPVLAVELKLASTEKTTDPLPEPDPLMMWIHDGIGVDEVQAQPGPALTTILPFPLPAAENCGVEDGTVMVQTETALYVAVIVTLAAGIVTVVLAETILATFAVWPVH